MIKPLMIAALLAVGGTQIAAQSLVGKWDCNARKGKGLAMRMLLEYRNNDHFYHRANVAVGDRRGRMDASISMRGTWMTVGNELIENVNSGRVTAISVDKRDISKTPFGKQASASLRQQIVDPNNPSRMQFTFTGASKMRLKDGTFRATCTKR